MSAAGGWCGQLVNSLSCNSEPALPLETDCLHAPQGRWCPEAHGAGVLCSGPCLKFESDCAIQTSAVVAFEGSLEG